MKTLPYPWIDAVPAGYVCVHRNRLLIDRLLSPLWSWLCPCATLWSIMKVLQMLTLRFPSYWNSEQTNFCSSQLTLSRYSVRAVQNELRSWVSIDSYSSFMALIGGKRSCWSWGTPFIASVFIFRVLENKLWVQLGFILLTEHFPVPEHFPAAPELRLTRPCEQGAGVQKRPCCLETQGQTGGSPELSLSFQFCVTGSLFTAYPERKL